MASIGLRTKFLLGAIGLVMITGLVIIIFVRISLVKKLNAEFQQRAVSMARHIAKESEAPLLTENIILLKLHFMKAKSTNNLVYIFILNRDGNVHAHTFGNKFPIDLINANTVQPAQAYNIKKLITEQGPLLDIATPVLKGELGIIRVGISEKVIQNTITDFSITFFLILGGVSIIVVIATIIIVMKITKPIFALTEAAKIVGSGNLEYKVPVGTKDEIGKLGAAFNDMIAKRREAQEKLQRKLKELSALYSISTIVGSSNNMEEVMVGVFKNAAEVLGAETGSLMMLGEKDQLLTIKAFHGLKEEVVSQTRVKLGEGICGWVAQTGQPLLFKNGISDTQFKPVVEETEIRHTICAPVKYANKIMGVINLNRQTSLQPFTEEDLKLLCTIAREIAIATQNINLYNELRTTIIQLEQANKEIKGAQAQLIQSEKLASLGQLAAGVAHEINNPLAVVAGRAEFLLMVGGKDPETTKGLKTILEQTVRASKIVGNLLEFSRQRKHEIEPVDINPVVEKAVFLIKHQISLGNIQVFKELKGDLPKIMGNVNQLQQVFVNLITNANQAMPEGGKLTISTALSQESLVIKFTDTGRGIPKENLKKLFDPFFTTKESGTGLGLSIIYGIIQAHNGTIEVESQVGQGTTFTIKIPVIKEGLIGRR